MGGSLGQDSPEALSRIGVEDDPRQDALGRLIVRSLEPIIGDDAPGARPDGPIPRSAAIGVIAAVKEALGPRTLREYEALCRKALVRLSRGRNVPRWDAFYEDDTARRVLESTLVKTAFRLGRAGAGVAAFAAWVDAAHGGPRERRGPGRR